MDLGIQTLSARRMAGDDDFLDHLRIAGADISDGVELLYRVYEVGLDA